FRCGKRTCAAYARGAKRPEWSKKEPPLGTCEIQAIRACRSADGRNVGATSQDTDWTPFTASKSAAGAGNCRQTIARPTRSVKRMPAYRDASGQRLGPDPRGQAPSFPRARCALPI